MDMFADDELYYDIFQNLDVLMKVKKSFARLRQTPQQSHSEQEAILAEQAEIMYSVCGIQTAAMALAAVATKHKDKHKQFV